MVFGESVARTWVESKKLGTGVKEVDKLRKQKPVDANAVFTLMNLKLPVIAARQSTIPAK